MGGRNRTQNHFPVPIQKTGKTSRRKHCHNTLGQGHWVETALSEKNYDRVYSVASAGFSCHSAGSRENNQVLNHNGWESGFLGPNELCTIMNSAY